MSVIEEVINKLEAVLLTDDEGWGNNLFWSNFDNTQKEEGALPATLIYFPTEDTTDYSTVNSFRAYNFTVRGAFWDGEKITTKARYLNQINKNEDFKALFKTFLDDLCTVTEGSAWLSGDKDVLYESIDQRFYINQTFTIKIEELS